jgi:hypothetical protein
MDYHRITSITDPLFVNMYELLKTVFPPEEVLAFDLWKEPLEDPSIRVFVAVHEGEVVGTTEYRYYEKLNVGMTDFTIIGREGLGVGRFLATKRAADLQALAEANDKEMAGMFAEIYDPYRVEDHGFGGVKPMDPFVRREVLSHLGYKRLNFPYVHPSWQLDGTAVSGLDLCFMPVDYEQPELSAELIATFLETYYAVLPEKPNAWVEMIDGLKARDSVALLAI